MIPVENPPPRECQEYVTPVKNAHQKAANQMDLVLQASERVVYVSCIKYITAAAELQRQKIKDKFFSFTVQGSDNTASFDAPVSFFTNENYPETDWKPNYSTFTVKVTRLM